LFSYLQAIHFLSEGNQIKQSRQLDDSYTKLSFNKKQKQKKSAPIKREITPTIKTFQL